MTRRRLSRCFCDRCVRAAGVRMKSNITLAFEGEEEMGSPNLEKTIAANKELFAADLWLICRRPRVPDAAAVGDLRRPRHHVVRRDRVRRADRAAQRPVWQLGAQPGDDARAAADVDEGRQRPRPDSRLLRSGRAAERAGTRGIAERAVVDAQLRRDFWLGARPTNRRKHAVRAAHAAVAEHPRHGQQPHRRAGQQRRSRRAPPRRSTSAS